MRALGIAALILFIGIGGPFVAIEIKAFLDLYCLYAPT